MKKLTEVPAGVLDQIKSEHQLALDTIFSKTICTYRMPMHTVAMRILRVDGTEGIEQVIIPAIVIHLTGDAFITKNTLDRDCIKYSLESTRKPFPFGHVYQHSGHVCLGNIFVPSAVSCHSPQQPLETLFLYNDRNVNHGDSCIYLSDTQITEIKKIVNAAGITLPPNMDAQLKANCNLVRDDTVWVLSAFILQTAPSQAFDIMHQIFDIIFPPLDTTEK